MTDAVQAGRGLVDYPGLYPNATGTVVANISGVTAIPGPITLAALAAAMGSTSYQGTWNASTNTPTLASSAGTNGYYYVVSVAGTTTLNGISDWTVGDWAIYNGNVSAWQKVEGGATTMTVGTTTVTGGTSPYLLYNNAGVLANTTTPAVASLALGGATIGSDALAVTGTASFGGAVLVGDAANILALRNGGTNLSAVPQTFRVYNFYTDASNYERITSGWASNIYSIIMEGAGTGSTSRVIRLDAQNTQLDIASNGVILRRNSSAITTLLDVSSTGMSSTALLYARLAPSINQTVAPAAGTYTVLDINPTETSIGAGPHYLIRGRLGAGSNVFEVQNNGTIFGTNAYIASGGYLGWSGRAFMRATADGVIKLGNSAETGFTMLQFGGTTSSFGALRTNGTTIEVKTADDGGYAAFTAYSLSSRGPNGVFNHFGATQFSLRTDGNALLQNNAQTDFSLLQFGGTTSSFPAIKKSGTTILARLADDSAYTGFAAQFVRAIGTTVAGLVAAATAGGGSVAYVTDATVTTSRTTVVGGGSNKVMVWSDGTNWLIF